MCNIFNMHCTLKYTKDFNNILSNYLIVHMFRAFSSQKMPYSTGQSGIPTKKIWKFWKIWFWIWILLPVGKFKIPVGILFPVGYGKWFQTGKINPAHKTLSIFFFVNALPCHQTCWCVIAFNENKTPRKLSLEMAS